LARTNDVEFIVSGDKDLLEWETQQPPVMTPTRFEQRSRTT
jgi:predicted nucleic acid-binding protein